MSALMRTHDWSASPLGWPAAWPQSLRLVAGLLPYNDAYAEILGAKHPKTLGARFDDNWAEIWPDVPRWTAACE